MEPITLSLVTLEPLTAYPPDVIGDFRPGRSWRAIGANVSAYRVVVTNR